MSEPELTVLALDIAKNRSGWAVGAPSWRRPLWGSHELPVKWDGNEGRCLHAWRRFLCDTMDRHAITYLAVEALFVDMKDFNFNGTVPIAQLHGIAIELAEERRIRVGDAAIASWRKHFVGTGIPPKFIERKDRTDWWKRTAIKACVDRNWFVEYHDEAEALGIMDYTLSCFDEDYRHRNVRFTNRAAQRISLANFRGDESETVPTHHSHLKRVVRR
ncbi:hypothetical protein [Aestuariivirga sp.]|uniref:hypothetical protein n=1 Tax=Aestuariivirga sp. TaxID=2650926 RepID=UPI0039E4D81E